MRTSFFSSDDHLFLVHDLDEEVLDCDAEVLNLEEEVADFDVGVFYQKEEVMDLGVEV